ncbi:MAG: DUF6169 family protein [Niastella sp.]|uniref:DUF6169 family protein n=1 Tax=Niastella sp. TaxID=1869183 RepID=UPI00389B07B1
MYKIAFDPYLGSYHFHTENGLTYACHFQDWTRELSPVLGIYDIQVCEFDFTCQNPDTQNCEFNKYNKHISATISQLILNSFASELRVITYVCDTSDGRHKIRHKLFKHWFKNLAEQENYIRIPIEIDLKDEMSGFSASAHGGVITRKDFPHMEVLQKEFIDEIPNIFAQKIGILQSS